MARSRRNDLGPSELGFSCDSALHTLPTAVQLSNQKMQVDRTIPSFGHHLNVTTVTYTRCLSHLRAANPVRYRGTFL